MNWKKQYQKALTFSYDDGNVQDKKLPVYSTGGVSALKVGSSFRPLLSVFMANR